MFVFIRFIFIVFIFCVFIFIAFFVLLRSSFAIQLRPSEYYNYGGVQWIEFFMNATLRQFSPLNIHELLRSLCLQVSDVSHMQGLNIVKQTGNDTDGLKKNVLSHRKTLQ